MSMDTTSKGVEYMTTLANQLLACWKSLVEDISDMSELDSILFVRDYDDLAASVQNRGHEEIFFLKLPEICSDLENSLETGKYVRRAQGPLTALKGTLPRFLNTLYLSVFSEDGMLLETPNPEAIRHLRQALRVFKKYDVDCPTASKERAIDAFVSIEQELPDPSLSWGADDLVVSRGFPSLVDLVYTAIREPRVREILDADFAGWNEGQILRDASYVQLICDRTLKGFGRSLAGFKPKHGPGAVAERFDSSKYEFPSWPQRLEKFFPFSDWGIPNLNFAGQELTEGFLTSPPAKLIGVPKDFKGPRLIASEPIAAQFVQQGLMMLIRSNISKTVLHHSLSIEDQEPSKNLALLASVDRSFSTIDLSSASDRLSCSVVECVFRRSFSFLEALNSARTPQIVTPRGTLTAKKFAAQGAAFTFPIQSIVYTMICAGVILSDSPSCRHSDIFRKVRVYGDDMIVPSDVFTRICTLITALHLRVNTGKSFKKGFFRESCGMDAYAGVNVTPAYIGTVHNPRMPTSTESVIECSNNLYLKGYIRTSVTLLDSIPWHIRKWVPYVRVGSTILGIKSHARRARKTRYNRDLHRYESKILAVESKALRTSIDGQYRLHQWFVESPTPGVYSGKDQSSVWSSGEVRTVKARHRLRWVDASLLG